MSYTSDMFQMKWKPYTGKFISWKSQSKCFWRCVCVGIAISQLAVSLLCAWIHIPKIFHTHMGHALHVWFIYFIIIPLFFSLPLSLPNTECIQKLNYSKKKLFLNISIPSLHFRRIQFSNGFNENNTILIDQKQFVAVLNNYCVFKF